MVLVVANFSQVAWAIAGANLLAFGFLAYECVRQPEPVWCDDCKRGTPTAASPPEHVVYLLRAEPYHLEAPYQSLRKVYPGCEDTVRAFNVRFVCYLKALLYLWLAAASAVGVVVSLLEEHADLDPKATWAPFIIWW